VGTLAVALSSATSIIEDGMDKNQIANLLDQIATLLELKEGSSPFEVRAYQNAARAINALDGDIEQLAREGKLKGVPGVGPTIIKRVEEGSWLKGWIARLRGSRARRVLRGAAILEFAGFARPEPLAAAEARAVGAIRTSYVISEALDGSRIMSDVVLSGGRRNFRQRCEVSSAIAKQIRRLHDAGIYTLDLQETNLMVEAQDGELIVYFIDLEDFRRRRSVPSSLRMLNLIHLDRSIGRFLSRAPTATAEPQDQANHS